MDAFISVTERHRRLEPSLHARVRVHERPRRRAEGGSDREITSFTFTVRPAASSLHQVEPCEDCGCKNFANIRRLFRNN